MARVVRRRKNPLLPVLLIFVFLFLIAAVLATLAYNNWKEDAKAKVQVLAARRKIISDTELRDSAVKSIISEYDKPRKDGSKAPTVVAELTKRIAELTMKITGSETTAAAAIEQIESSVGPDTFVLNAIKTARAANTVESNKVKELEGSITTLTSEKRDADAAYKALEKEFTAKATALAEETRKLAAANTALATAHDKAMKASDATWREKVAVQEQEVDTQVAKVTVLTEKGQKDAILIDILQRKLRDRKKTKDLDLAIREAGKVKEIMSDRDVCFIPLGTRDRVVRGMTFRVYGPEGVPKDGEGHKAALTVIRVFKTVSQCRISTVRADDPVAIGDAFANIAFDPAQQPVFVVEGRFDLGGTGRLTETGTQEVISLIKRSGGRIASKLTMEVDFVVMGPEPSKPPKLPEDAAGPAKKAWEIRMEEYNRWHGTLDRAIALNVPKLNTKRFLTLTGYENVRRYED